MRPLHRSPNHRWFRNLGRFCKEGDVEKALDLALKKSSRWCGYNLEDSTRLERSVFWFFGQPWGEGKIIDFVIKGGHTDMAYIFLSMLVLSRINPPAITAIEDVLGCQLTMKHWLDKFGFPGSFPPKAFQKCVLAAKNKDIEAVFCHNKYSLLELATSGSSFSAFTQMVGGFGTYSLLRPVPPKPRIRPQRTRRPCLVVESDYDTDMHFSYGDDSSFVEPEDDETAKNAPGLGEHLEEHGIDISLLSPAEPPEEEANAADGIIHNEGWLCVSSDPSSGSEYALRDVGALPSENDGIWENISDVDSVISLDSALVKESYLDIAKRGDAARKATTTATYRMPTTSPPSPPAQPTIQEDDALEGDQYHDAYFIMEGVKCSRGGRNKNAFKGNPKKKTRSRGRS